MTRHPDRVAVIEIGSRAVRLLVADVRQGRLEPVLTRADQARPIAILDLPPAARAPALRELEGIVRAYHALAGQKGVTDVSVFGTEALRRLKSADALPSGILSAARRLSTAEEARYAVLAALSGHEAPSGTQVLIVDQGGGSLDAAAVLTSSPPEILETASLNFGVERLLKMFEASGRNLTAYRAAVENDLKAPSFPDRQFVGAMVLGSVSTKCGWLSSPRPPGARYSPASVHGISMRTAGLQSMTTLFERAPFPAWDRFRALFDPGDPESDDLERVVVGAVALAAFLKNSGIEEFFVSALGTRHGLALEHAARNGPAG